MVFHAHHQAGWVHMAHAAHGAHAASASVAQQHARGKGVDIALAKALRLLLAVPLHTHRALRSILDVECEQAAGCDPLRSTTTLTTAFPPLPPADTRLVPCADSLDDTFSTECIL